MKRHGVVPDVIDKPPAQICKVSYPTGIKVQMGNELTPRQVKDIPHVKWEADDSSFYTLCLTDPDIPSRDKPDLREWHHWLVGNIPGTNINQGETLTEYVGSGPPKGTGLHRYIFLIYKQKSKLKFDEQRLFNNSADNRANFSTKKFADKYEMGDPIAGNFYQAEWDDYVPILYKQLGAENGLL